jgi:hypothetical protein
MKKIFFIGMLASLLGFLPGCKKDSDFLNIPPNSVLPTDVAFSDPALVISILGDLYNRQVEFSNFDGSWSTFADFSESFPSDGGAYNIVQRTGWDYGSWGTYDYGYVRELNLFIQRDSASTKLAAADKARFLAEGRFLRANYYFEMVKRMGGVPLILAPLEYNYKGDASYLQVARSKESDIYDFVISEAEAIKNALPSDPNEKSRATKGVVLAMEARAALYAASIAKYGATTPQVSLPGAEVGIPASKATGYYTTALAAAQSLINGDAGPYKLYKVLPDLSDNFAAIFTDKSTVNQESIFVDDYKALAGKVHNFTVNDQPYSFSDEGGDAGRLDPSLNLVEAFEKLDNTYAPIPTTDGGGNPIFYTNQTDIFNGRDARLRGTVLVPGSQFKGNTVDIWAGYVLADNSIFTADQAGTLKALPGTTALVQVVGKDGPVNGLDLRTQSGFYIRKYLDPTVGSGRRGRGSDVALIHYRFGEVLLNAAEAAFELGQNGVAVGYLNQVRARAGLITPLTGGDVTFDRIVHERRVELAFEGHILFDYKRWRIAASVWDGTATTKASLLANIGAATKRSTQPWGLWPYKYYNPASPNNGKWLYQETLPAKVTGVNQFRLGNYYSAFDPGVLGSNPKIVKQPNQ